jgi:hypothetical protein
MMQNVKCTKNIKLLWNGKCHRNGNGSINDELDRMWKKAVGHLLQVTILESSWKN